MPGEEEQVLDAFAEVRKQHQDLTLLIAPRHPERFDTVERTIRARGFEVSRRTRTGAVSEVLLLDSVGELASTFRHASVVFVGGSLVSRGGHNILEPAAFSKPIIFGPHMENFREIRDMFIEEDAAVEVHNAAELATAVAKFLADPAFGETLGARARQLVTRNTGATERVLAYLR
jgi:3-deoxy-D-manno-octulosonic-acid transferase